MPQRYRSMLFALLRLLAVWLAGATPASAAVAPPEAAQEAGETSEPSEGPEVA